MVCPCSSPTSASPPATASNASAPTTPEVARFLSIQAGRLRRQRAVLVWAVMPEAAADEIMDELRFGEKLSALRLLQSTSRECGQLMTR